jgi:hypothetical protein
MKSLHARRGECIKFTLVDPQKRLTFKILLETKRRRKGERIEAKQG